MRQEAVRSPELACPWKGMIQLTRLNHQHLLVNSDLIKFVEESPDTVVTLLTGEKMVVKEKASEVIERVIDFRRSVLKGIALTWDSSSFHLSAPKTSETDGHGSER